MPVKTYSIPWALEQIQPGSKWKVGNNDSDQIIYIEWTGDPPTDAELDTVGAGYVKESVEAETDLARDRFVRTLFELNYDQETRLRVLESAPAITKAQYKNALINLYKSTT